MFIPLYDDNPLRRIATPIVTRALIVVSVSVFVLFESGFVFDAQTASVGLFGVIPAEFHLGGGLRSELVALPESLTLVTYMFFHGGWMLNLFMALDKETAYWAHIGGLAAGAVLIPFMRRPDVPLFDRGTPA